MTKQIHGSIIRVKREELNESAKRQSHITQNEMNKTTKRVKRPHVKSLVHIVYLKLKKIGAVFTTNFRQKPYF